MSFRSRAALSFLLATGCPFPFLFAQSPGGSRSDPRVGLAAALRAAGSLQSRVRFEHITSANGLSNDSVFAILQDHHGFLWFGTQGGLNRYDGYRMTHYRLDPKDPNSIPSDSIQGLFEDSHGSIWTLDDLSRFDSATEKFTRYKLPPDTSGEYGKGTLWTIQEDLSGFLWLGGFAQWPLYRLAPGLGPMTGYEIRGDSRPGQDLVISASVRDDTGIFWLATSQGLVRFDPAAAAGAHLPFPQQLGISDPLIKGIARDKAGNLWLAANEEAPILFDRVSQTFARRWPLRRVNAKNDWNGTIFAATDGTLWRSVLHGLGVFDPVTGTVAYLRHDPADPHSLSEDTALCIAGDREGNVWVGTKGGGVNRFSAASLRFGAWRRTNTDPGSLSDDNVRAVLRDRTGVLWIGTYAGGLNRFDAATGQFIQFRHDPRNPRSLDDDRVYSIYEDRSGILWIGTGLGINRLDRATGTFTHFRRTPVGLADNFSPTYSFLEDRTGRFWFGTSMSRARLDRTTGSITPVASTPGVFMWEDQSGNLWFDGPGLLKLDATEKISRFSLSRPQDIHGPQVNFSHEDAKGILWLGTETGLFRFDPRDGQYTSYTTQDGLPDNVIQCVLPDRAGNLWLSTNNGLTRFNPQDRTFTSYHESDGLQAEQFNRKACFADASGMLYFGGVHGFNAFDPPRIPADEDQSFPVLLTEFDLNGKPVPTGPGSLLSNPLPDTEALHLSHRQNSFSFEFAALYYRNPARTRYRFKLENLESQWTEVDSRHRLARYTDLAPGTYRFRVQASTSGGKWSTREASIGIAIAPPWWMTWWFRGLVALAAAGLLLGAHKVRVRALKKREQLLQTLVARRTAELVEARNQAEVAKDLAEQANRAKSAFLANMSHELRTPLNAILGFSNLLRNRGASGQQKQDLDTIHRSGEHLLTLIDDVLDVAKIEAGRTVILAAHYDLRRLVSDVVEMMRVRAQEKQLKLLLEESPAVPQFTVCDGAKLRQILINLLGNAIKFTEEGSVTLRLDAQYPVSAEHALVRFEVQDTGIGIAPEDHGRIFDAFEQVAHRHGKKGTGLGLAITSQFVELMGGTITLDSTPGKGSCFRFEIPLEVPPPGEECTPELAGEVVGLEDGQPECRILLVEDVEESRVMLERMLCDVGFPVRVAENGARAIEVFEEWHPHFIFMDLTMPVMDGTEAAERIRRLPGGSQIRIAAMTASVFVSERERVLAHGMDDFIRKPFRPEELFACLARHMSLRYRFALEPVAVPDEPDRETTRESLDALPPGLRKELADAVMSLDPQRVAAAAARVGEVDAALGRLLNSMNQEFAYTAMLRMVEPSALDGSGKSPSAVR